MFIPIIIAGVVVVILLFLPWNWWGIPPEDYVGLLNIRLYSTLSLVLYSYVIYILIAITVAIKQQSDNGFVGEYF